MRWIAALLVLGLAGPASGQGALGDQPRLYVGGGFGPGFGVVGTASLPTISVVTREVVVYADYVPRVTGGSGRLLTAVGVGGSVRLVRAYDVVMDRPASRYDLDLGLRIGPSFYTAFFEQTAESRSRAFSVMLDPFARGTYRLGGGRVVFAEIGTQAPTLRAGLSTTVGL
ncbi:MAG: hypothetical protein AAGI52_18845 [Bacteroidota bacterium]